MAFGLSGLQSKRQHTEKAFGLSGLESERHQSEKAFGLSGLKVNKQPSKIVLGFDMLQQNNHVMKEQTKTRLRNATELHTLELALKDEGRIYIFVRYI